MSAKNGGRGVPPELPDGHGPPEPQAMEVSIAKTIIRPSNMTTANKDEFGNLHLSFVEIEGNRAVQHTWVVEEGGQKNILDVLTGGIELATPADIPKASKQ